MGQIITIVLLLGSLGGIVFILRRKMPLLVELPEEGGGSVREYFASQAKGLVNRNLNRTFAEARKIASKTEVQTGELLRRLRKKSEERKEEFSESYREQLSKKPEE